ncbi:MAG: hypothetical protein QXL86_02740 [Candidatus Aenigmatarchaeota archaeon]
MPDIDKLFTYSKKKFKGHESRTMFSEIPVGSIIIFFSIFINKDLTLGLISHYLIDYLVGETKPFYPFFKNIVDFNLKFKYKIILGVILWTIGGVLFITQWINL